MQTSDDIASVRGGFWRRTLALGLDSLSVAIPCAVLAGLLFAASAGRIQASVGLDLTTCESRTSFAGSLSPEPPQDSNFATECRTRSLAGPTRHVLMVGREVRTETPTTLVSQKYMLGDDGTVVNGVDWSWGVPTLLLLYLVGSQWRAGRTLGLRATGLRLVPRSDPSARRVPLGRVVLRYVLCLAGYLPAMLIVAFVLYRVATGPADATPAIGALALAPILAAAWSLWNVVRIARKRDALYDHWAGTAVVRAPAS